MTQSNEKNLLAKNLKYLRKILGLFERGEEYSQTELAELLMVTRQTINKWESGQFPGKTKLAQLAEFYSNRFGTVISQEDLIWRDMRSIIRIVPAHLPSREERIEKLIEKLDSLDEELFESVYKIVERL